MHLIERQVRAMAEPTAPWLVCVSGGADSMALLHACVRTGVEIVAAHCNFGLRGEESMRDEEHVRRRCAELGVELHVTSFDTEEYCRRHGLSLEMGCRRLRYDWFRSLVSQLSLNRIAVAHNADDDNETMLLNLLRGTGIRGLTGMAADSGEIVRPLLGVHRSHIEQYLNEIGATWVTDSSNLASDFKRNFLRNEILPALRSRWPGLDKSLALTRKHLRDTDKLVENTIADIIPEGDTLPSAVLENCPAPGELIYRWSGSRGASPSQIAEMAESGCGARWQLPGATMVKNADGLHRIPNCAVTEPRLCIETLPNSPALYEQIRSAVSQDVLYCAPDAELHLRVVTPKDVMQPLGMQGRKRVMKVLKDARIPAERRSGFMLVADAADRVVWLPGVRRSALHTVSAQSPSIQKITLTYE